MRNLAVCLILFTSLLCYGQYNLSLYTSSGYIDFQAQRKQARPDNMGYNFPFITLRGVNFELGAENEFVKRISWSIFLRYSDYANTTYAYQVYVSTLSTNISYILINRSNHRFMFGPGISYGIFNKKPDINGVYKYQSNSMWWPDIKVKYDYTIKDRYQIGMVAAKYGDGMDGSNYLGFTFGYKIVSVGNDK